MSKDKKLIDIVLEQGKVKHNILEDELLTAVFDYCIQQMPGAIYYKDKKGKYLGCSNYLISSSGFTSVDDVIGKTDFDLFSFEQAEILRKNDEKVINDGKILVTEEKITLPNGDTQYFEVVKTPLRDIKGKIVGIIGNSIEITDRVKAEKNLILAKEEAQLANVAKSQFISDMEHDLRTPCSGIAAMAEILEAKENDLEKKETLYHIAQASNRLLNILNGILAFDKVEAGIFPIIDKKFSIKKMVDDIFAMEMPSIIPKNVALMVEYDENIPEVIIGDEGRIERILLNLVSNAVKFTPTGNIIVYVEMPRIIDQQHAILRVTVKDTGIGIPEDKIQSIYERFVRVAPANQNKYMGSGLGLSVVKRFLEDIKGEIDVESVLGQGTKFTCTFPIKLPLVAHEGRSSNENIPIELKQIKQIKQENKSNSAAKISSDKSPKKRRETGKVHEKGNINVLLVEDDALAQLVASQLLKEHVSNNLDVANSGEDALKLISKNKYNLIFMDIGLPHGITGYEVTKKIRKLKSNKNKSAIIVALTAHDTQKEKQKAYDAGMDDFLNKPLSVEKVRKILQKFVYNDIEESKRNKGKNSKIKSKKISKGGDF